MIFQLTSLGFRARSKTLITHPGWQAFALIDHEPVPVVDLAVALALPAGDEDETVAHVALVDLRGERVALRVGRFVGQEEIYLKPVPELLSRVKALAGLTLLGDGSPIFLLDLNHLA